ncbi:MAG: hypothetical protein RLZZ511_1804 [Cyanobacteriota bacterium]|jgi:hypothetical protein
MKFKRYIRSLFPLAIALISLTPNAQASKPKTQCPLDRATYTAIGKPAFELQFNSIEKRRIATEIIALTIQHRDRGSLGSYHLGRSQGYGSYYMQDLAKSVEDDTDADLKPVFFNANLQQANNPETGNAPKYVFISGLGSRDWYTDRPGHRETPIGEVMWQISGCRP